MTGFTNICASIICVYKKCRRDLSGRTCRQKKGVRDNNEPIKLVRGKVAVEKKNSSFEDQRQAGAPKKKLYASQKSRREGTLIMLRAQKVRVKDADVSYEKEY